MRLVKDGRVFNTSDEDVISAYKGSGWVEEAEAPKAEAPKKTTAKN